MPWRTGVLVCAGLALLSCGAFCAPRYTIDGQPVIGSFAFEWQADDLRDALDTGINLVFCYDRRSALKLLDPATDTGGLLMQRRAKVMYNLLMGANSCLLTEDIDAEVTQIPVSWPRIIEEPGVFWIGDEAVHFERLENRLLHGCTRGYRGTTPAAHPAQEYIVNEDMVREEILKRKDSPNLWGYWVMDDKNGRNVLNALRNVNRIIKQTDVDENGEPNPHVVVAGMPDEDALTNFDAGVCDIAGIYIYPARRGAYRSCLISDTLRRMLPVMRERSPQTPFMGIFQAFTNQTWRPKPSRAQVRQQVTDFVHYGASSLMVYSWRMIEGTEALRNLPDLREEMGQIAGDLREGRIELDQAPPEYPERDPATPDLSTLAPLMVFSEKPDTPAQENAGVSAELSGGPDGTGWYHMRFGKYLPGKQEWPGVRLGRASWPQDASFADSGWLVVRIHNYLGTNSEVGISIRDSRGEPWWAQYYPLPANCTTDVCAPISEMRRMIDLSDVAGVTLLMRRPQVDTHLAVQGLYLAPAQFARVPGARYHCARVQRAPTVDGSAGDECWQQTPGIALEDARLDAPPVRATRMRVARRDGTLYLLVRSDAGAPADLIVSEEPEARWETMDDTVECRLRHPESGRTISVAANPAGRCRARLLDARGKTCGQVEPVVASVVEDGMWTLEMALDTNALGDWPRELEFNLWRHDSQIGPLVWARDHAMPVGLEPVGVLETGGG